LTPRILRRASNHGSAARAIHARGEHGCSESGCQWQELAAFIRASMLFLSLWTKRCTGGKFAMGQKISRAKTKRPLAMGAGRMESKF
jgi:hypothetical protein